MGKTITAVFDGRVLHPDSPLDLVPDTRYLITIQDVPPSAPELGAWDVLATLVGSLEAPADWAAEHDHYLYGTPKRQSSSST